MAGGKEHQIVSVPELMQRAKTIVESTAPTGSTLAKQAERKALLAQRPELKLRIDAAPLRQIINYVDFKCSPFSSIARDEAIVGSDIDGGVVVTADQTTRDQELSFVKALRAQGFEAYHEIEVAEAHQRVDEGLETEQYKLFSNLSQSLRDLIRKASLMDSSKIVFYNEEALREIIASGNLEMPIPIYLAGFRIK
jgi:hypothetical protein